MEERKNYLQILAFSTGPAMDILHLYFEAKVLLNGDFVNFLDDTKHKHILFHEFVPKTPCCECFKSVSLAAPSKRGSFMPPQFRLLYDETGPYDPSHEKKNGSLTLIHCLCKYCAKAGINADCLDITCMYSVITHCCSSGSFKLDWLKNIKDIRNELVHNGKRQINNNECDTKWNILEVAVLGYAGLIGRSCVNMFRRQIEELKIKGTNDLMKVIRDSKDNVCQILHNLNGVTPAVTETNQNVKELLSRQSVQENVIQDLKNTVDALVYAQFGEVKTVSEIKRHFVPSVRDENITETSDANSNPPTSGHEVIVKIQTPSSWDKTKIEQKLSERLNSASNSNEDELKLLKFEFKCLLLTTRASNKLVNDRPALMSAIGKFLKGILEDCEIDTTVPEQIFIEIDIYSETTEDDQKILKNHGKNLEYTHPKEKEINWELQKLNQDISELELKEDNDSFVHEIVEAHHKTCLYTDAEMTSLMLNVPTADTILSYISLSRRNLWLEITDILSVEMRMMIEFLKMIPGFIELSPDDQIILMKAGVFEVSIIQCWKAFQSKTNSVIFGNGLLPLSAFFAFNSDEQSLMNGIFDVIQIIQTLDLSDTAFALYSAFLFTQPDRYGVKDTMTVKCLNGKIICALTEALSDRDELFDKLMTIAGILRILHAQYIQLVFKVKLTFPSITFDPLHDEIFSIKLKIRN